MSGATSTPRARRAEIQALRAVAVGLVLLFHVWPETMPGGYVGVDVFFVISGYLITGQLLRLTRQTGGFSLADFWARRARRLLPAALLVLGFCAVAVVAVVPRSLWDQFLTEIGASALYVQNWQLAGDAVDYLAADNRSSLTRHYWSLSLEEQFYVLWPLLVGGAVLAARRVRAVAVAGVLVLVTAASLVYGIVLTASDPAAAYFVTPTRAWEFGAGGLLALFRVGAPPRAVAAGASWAGLAMILAAGLLYDEGTAFPGTAALLPVFGALLVIHAGAPEGRFAPARLLRLTALQRTGDWSYALYLWHWPLLVLIPFVADARTFGAEVVVLVLTFALAIVTTRFVEDPVRHGAWLAQHPPRRTFVAAGAATLALFAVLAGANAQVSGDVEQAEERSVAAIDAPPRCFGAASRDPLQRCDNPQLRFAVAPEPLVAKTEPNEPCSAIEREGAISVCRFGVPPDQATRTVALIGDSHAAHWRPALAEVARRERWHAVSITRTSCPFSAAEKVIPGNDAAERCAQWNDELPAWFVRHPEVSAVFVGASTTGEVVRSKGRSMVGTRVTGYRAAWATLPQSVRQVLVLRDTPRVGAETFDCVDSLIAGGERTSGSCAVRRDEAMQRDPQFIAARAARADGSRRVRVVDLTETICDERECLPVVGGALVFKDGHHLTRAFAQTLGPLLQRQVAGV